MYYRTVFLSLAGILLSSAVSAQELPPVQELPLAPPPPPQVQSGEVLEPEITIMHGERQTVTEYRLNGRLYMVKITPHHGFPPYYLMDADGDGRLETRRAELDPGFLVPHWVLFRW